MYNVARRELTAGLPGKRIEKIFEVKLVVSGMLARLCSLRDSTKGQFWWFISPYSLNNMPTYKATKLSRMLHPES